MKKLLALAGILLPLVALAAFALLLLVDVGAHRPGIEAAASDALGMEVGALDEKGCARLRQRIRGSFRNPTPDKVSMLESATAPLLGLLEQTEKLPAPGTCRPFCEGTVAHPG